MRHPVIKASTYKHAATALSAVLLLSTVSCVSTTSSNTSSSTQANDTKVNNTKTNLIKTADGCHVQASSHKGQSVQQQAIDCMLAQLPNYQQSDKTAHQQYWAYKAQAWLNYATHQTSINSRSATATYAVNTAESILQALQDNTAQNIDLQQDIPSFSALMRPDLWATLSALKDSDGITSAPREIAFSEVALIWAATNQCERGARESGLHFRMADRWLDQAREAYVNAHDSTTNVALEKQIVGYYQHYAPLDASDDTCRGQALTPLQPVK